MSSSSTPDWKTQPPYQKPTEDFNGLLHGSCHCGKVTYQINKDKPLASKFCHCTDCQVLHGESPIDTEQHDLTRPGAPFQWAAILKKSDMAFTEGIEGLAFYHAPTGSDKHELPCKVSCAHCGSRIMDEGRNMALLFPSLLFFPTTAQRRNFDVQ